MTVHLSILQIVHILAQVYQRINAGWNTSQENLAQMASKKFKLTGKLKESIVLLLTTAENIYKNLSTSEIKAFKSIPGIAAPRIKLALNRSLDDETSNGVRIIESILIAQAKRRWTRRIESISPGDYVFLKVLKC